MGNIGSQANQIHCHVVGASLRRDQSCSALWTVHDGTKAVPHKADVMSYYMRLSESSFDKVHALSGQRGAYFELRNNDQPGPDSRSLTEALHRVKTTDEGLTIGRLGTKYGIRCLIKHEEELRKQLCSNKPCVQCSVWKVSPDDCGRF